MDPEGIVRSRLNGRRQKTEDGKQKKNRGNTAIILVSHGSKFSGFDAPLKKLRRILLKKNPLNIFLLAYLEINSPSISEAIDRCVRQGASHIKVLPYFVLGGNHTKVHIPEIVSEAKKKYRNQAKIMLCPYLGFHERIVEVVKERLECS